jgi:hypothetical protein
MLLKQNLLLAAQQVIHQLVQAVAPEEKDTMEVLAAVEHL